MCDYANSKISNASKTQLENAIHVSSYLMWKVNWIHPVSGGNGRTSRAVSYLALCSGLGLVLSGTPTIPDQIVAGRNPYYHALDAADTNWRQGILDVSEMESLLMQYLTIQLQSE